MGKRYEMTERIIVSVSLIAFVVVVVVAIVVVVVVMKRPKLY